MNRLPVRREGLLVRAVGAETVVVDPSHNTAHALSPVAASVFALCDGRLTVTAAASSLALPGADVESAVTSLAVLGLVAAPGMTRRVAIQRASLIGGGALVASVAAPLAAAHASGTGPGPTTGFMVGNATTTRGVDDTDPQAFYWQFRDLALTGLATQVQFTAYSQPNTTRNGAAASVTFLVIRDGTVVFASEPVTAPLSGIFSSAIDAAGTAGLQAGDVLGFYSTLPVIPFDGPNGGGRTGGTADAQTAAGPTPPAPGTPLSFDAPNLTRTYSVQAQFS